VHVARVRVKGIMSMSLVRIPERKQSAAIQESLKLGNLKTKGAVDMLDQMCATYTVQRATRRWTMAVF